MKKLKFYILGFFSGVLNGFFGSGGGLIAVPYFKKLGLEQKNAQATSIALILPLSIISGIVYIILGVPVQYNLLLIFIPFGILGSFIGSKLLNHLNNNTLRRVFAFIMIFSGIRLLFKW